MHDQEGYSIAIDSRWSLEDLYEFPRAFEQVYFAFEAVLPSQDAVASARLTEAFTAFPWRGGYSAVNFYNQLKRATPRERRPTIRAIKYASPGFIELYLNLPLAFQIAAVVSSIAGSIGVCNKVYNQIYGDLQSRKLLKLDVELKHIALTREQIALVTHANDEMAKMMGLQSANAITERTRDPLVALKIFLSLYRRLRTLAEFKNKNKATLPVEIGNTVGSQKDIRNADLF